MPFLTLTPTLSLSGRGSLSCVLVIVLTAAMRWEAEPLIRRWSLRPESEALYRGTRDGRDLGLLRTGVGPARTAQALDRVGTALGDSPVVISSGFAGALQPEVRPGELVADLRETPLEIAEAVRKTARGGRAALHLGAICSTDRAVAKPADKRALGELRRAVAVDMESETIRAWCASRGGAFLVVRTVLDGVGDRLPKPPPEDAERSAAVLARYAAGGWRDWPLMARLYWRQRRAMNVLGDFLDGLIREL